MSNNKHKFNLTNSYFLILIYLLIIVIAAFIIYFSFFRSDKDINNGNDNNGPDENTPTEVDKIKSLLNTMTLDEKIGQMIIGGYDNINDITPVIKDYKLGGIILYSKNIKTVDQTSSDVDLLNSNNMQNKIPLFITTDQEGGKVTRLPSEMGTFEEAMSIGNHNDPEYAFNSGVKIAEALKQLGFNLDFAPVLDIFSNPNNTVIANRAYGTTPGRVSKIGLKVLEGIRSKNIIPVAKHFPGHGDTDIDSHIGLPIVKKSLNELTNFEFIPFIDAIKDNVDMMMVAHIILSQIDDVPSTLSHKVVSDILRDQLGFNGVIITDDMTMGAISQNYSITDASVKAINAGCDIVLIAKVTQNSVDVFKAIKTAVQNGEISINRINDSVLRILNLKYKYDILK